MKRAIDITLSGLAIILLAPLFLPITIILCLTGEGEVFFRQPRIGRGGKRFAILKFATMLKNSPMMSGGDITTANDPRILPMGYFLRSTKINELPQLFNVLAGDMSLIGPRPLTSRVADMFPDAHWRAVTHLRPGLSGVGSIIFRDEEKLLSASLDRELDYALAIVPYKMALEQWYAGRQSVLLDFKLMILTVAVVLVPSIDPSTYMSDLPPVPQALKILRGLSLARNSAP